MQDFKYFKKIISKNILFMMILVLLLVGVSERIVNLMVANDSYVLDRNKSIFRILREPENSVDIIVLGDSLGMTSISPMAWWAVTETWVCVWTDRSENAGSFSYAAGSI